MGKILQGKRSISSLHSGLAGCSWGMLHLIKYHQWRHVKKTLTYKRHNSGAHAPTEGEVSSPLWNSSDLHISGINASSADKIPRQDDATVDQSIVEGEVAKPSIGKKCSVKARIKAFISEDMYKKKGRHHRSASCPVASPAQRDSLHQLKPADCPFVEMVLTDASPSIVHQNTSTFSDDNKLDSLPINTSKETITCNKSGDCDNIIATLNLEHDHDHFTTHQQKFVNKTPCMVKQKSTSAINANSLLLHSKEYLDALDIISVNKDLLLKILHDPGSPLAQHFHDHHTFSSKKGLTKSDSFPLPGSLRSASQPSKLKYNQGSQVEDKGKSEDYSYPQKSLLPISSKRIYEHSMSSTGSSQHLGNQGEDKVVPRPRFKDLKQKIKHFIKKSRKERHRVALDSIFHKVPRGQKFSEDLEKAIDGQMKDPDINEDKDDRSCNYSSNKNHRHQMRRASSFNESMDRYHHLYETTFREEGKNHTSERPKMRTKEANSSFNGVPKYLGRILSLPNRKSHVYENEESLDIGEMELTSIANNETDIQLDSHLSIVGNIMEDIGMNAESTVKSRLDTTDNSIEQIYEPKTYLSEASDDGLQMEKEETRIGESLNDDISHYEIDSAEFSYVRDILKLSGFSLGTWHSNDRPVVDPLVYEQVEGCLIHDPDCSGNDGGKCNHLLLFDLVNEVLIEIYRRSYSYCPIPLSSLCHIRPMPIGYHVVKEVWVLVSCYLSLRPEADQSVDQVVSCDLAKNDGWMNLQFDSECVGLELEDMILDDLLEELIWN